MSHVGVIGSGGWATALVKVLQDNQHSINWHMRTVDMLNNVQEKGRLCYCPDVRIDRALVTLHTNIARVCEQSEFILLATPSVFLEETLSPLSADILAKRKIISAIKGLTSKSKIPVSCFLEERYDIPLGHFAVLTGASHAEEVSVGNITYVSVASTNKNYAEEVCRLLTNAYFNCTASTQVLSSQYVGIVKNMYAIAVGIADGLGYGDNFNSALVASALLEMRKVIAVLAPEENIDDTYHQSCFAGDLLVTCYSRHSRNRRFGVSIGASHKIALGDTSVYPEGFYAAQYIMQKLGATSSSRFSILSAVVKSIKNPTKVRDIFSGLEKLMR